MILCNLINTYTYTHSRSRVPDKKRVEIGPLTSMARIEEEGVARGTVKDNERCNDSVEEADEIEVGSRKRKRRDSVSSL